MNVQELLKYFNLGVLAFILIFAFIGFIRGTYKSLFYLIATAVIFGGGFLLMGILTKAIANINVVSFNIFIGGIKLESINQFVTDFITNKYPNMTDLITQDTLVKELVFSFTNMVIKLAYVIVLIVLAFTILKLIVDVLWLVFKPRKKKGKRPKKSFLSRLGGAGIGSIKGVFYLLLICFPLAGIASIAQSIAVVDNNANNENLKYNLVFVNDTVTLVESEENNIIPSEFQQILDYIGIYKKSYAGKVFGTVKADQFIFDSIFSLQVNNRDVKLRKELETIAKAFSKSEKFLNGNSFNINRLLTEDPEVLKEIVDEISNLEIVKVAIPIGIEAALYLKDAEGNPVIKLPENLNIDIDTLKNLDYASDIKKLGYAFADFTSIYSFDLEPAEINYLGFDAQTVKSIMSNIGSTDIVGTFAPIAVSYIATIDSIEKALSQYGLTVDDLGLKDIEDWANEFTTFGKIYEAIADMEIKKLDASETFEHVTEEKVIALSNALFESVIISKSAPVIVQLANDKLIPNDYKNMISIDSNMINKDEFGALVNAILVLKKSNLLTTGTDALKELTTDMTNDLAKYLSESNIITSNLNTIIDTMLKQFNLFDENLNLKTLEKNEWNKTELTSLFNGFRIIMQEGYENIIKIEDDKIKELTSHLANSKFITRNFEVIVDKALKEVDLKVDIQVGTFDKWEDPVATEREFYNLFKAAKIIQEKGDNEKALLSLEAHELDYLLKSQIISETLVSVIKSFSKPGSELDFLVGVEDDTIEWYDKDFLETLFTLQDKTITITPVEGATRYNIYGDDVLLASTRKLAYTFDLETMPEVIKVEAFKEGELRKMYSVIGSLTESLNGEKGFSVDVITKLTDDDIEGIIASDILVLSLVNKLEEMAVSDPNFVVVIPKGPLTSENRNKKLLAWKYEIIDGKKYDGELAKAIRGLKILLANSTITNFKPEDITKLTDNEIDEILKSDVLTESIVMQIYKQSDDATSPVIIPDNQGLGKDDSRDVWKSTYQLVDGNFVKVSEGELTKVLRALKIVLDGQDFNNIDVNKILKKDVREVVLESKIIEATIINKVETEAEKENSIIAIPKRLKNNKNLWYSDASHGEGELHKLLNALDFIMDETGSISNFELDLSIIVTNKDEILKSEVLIESVIKKIMEQQEIHIPRGYGLLDEDDRLAWTNTYLLDTNFNYTYDEEGKVIVLRYGEISHLLDAADLIVKADPVTGKRTFDNINFKIDEALDKENHNIILKSLVISETIVQKIFEESRKPESLIAIPKSSTYVNQVVEDSRDKWFNVYNADGSLYQKGEIAYLLEAADILLEDGTEFSNINIDLNKIFEGNNQELILRSKVLSESIVQKIYDESTKNNVTLPPAIYLEVVSDVPGVDTGGRSKWYNTYNSDGSLKQKGEIAHLLDAANILIKADPVTGKKTLENINFKVDDAFDKDSQKVLLKSLIISETIVHKIYEESKKVGSLIKVPKSSTYINQIEVDDNRDKWFNSYDNNGEVISYGEIAYLLEAADLLLADGVEFTNIEIDLNNIFADNNQDIILKSKVISETIVQKLYDESINGEIRIPSTLYLDHVSNDVSDTGERLRWYNEYNADGSVKRKGEIAHLLEAANILMSQDPVTGKKTLENISFKIDDAFDINKQKILLRSLIISETIVHKIFDEDKPESLIKIPKSTEYVNQINEDDSREKWFNLYNDNDEIISYGEIAHLLEAAKLLLADGVEFKDISFDLSKVFNEIYQKEILKSKVFSETIVHMIYKESGNGILIMPASNYVNSLSDVNRDKWFNTYDDNDEIVAKGEIANLLNAAKELLPEGATFANIDFEIGALFTKPSQQIILKSYIFSETIITKILNNTNAITNIPNTDWDGRSLTNAQERGAWYNEYTNNVIVENELAKLLDGIKLIVGELPFEQMQAIRIEDILQLNFNIEVNEDKMVTSSDFDILLNSVVLESIISPLVEMIATNTLASFLVVPSDGYHFYKQNKVNPYDTKSFLDSLYFMKKAGLDYNNLGSSEYLLLDLGDESIEILATSMVISRVFKGSIAKLFNTILDPITAPLGIFANQFRFDQSNYDGEPLEAYTNLYNKLKFIQNIKNYI